MFTQNEPQMDQQQSPPPWSSQSFAVSPFQQSGCYVAETVGLGELSFGGEYSQSFFPDWVISRGVARCPENETEIVFQRPRPNGPLPETNGLSHTAAAFVRGKSPKSPPWHIAGKSPQTKCRTGCVVLGTLPLHANKMLPKEARSTRHHVRITLRSQDVSFSFVEMKLHQTARCAEDAGHVF